MGRQWPSSVVNAQRALGVLVGLMALASVLTVFLDDDLIRAWAERNDAAKEILDEGGIQGLRDSSLALPAFVPVALVMFVVMLGLLAVLRVFFREGFEWARMSLVGVGVLIGVAAGLIAFREGPPLVFVLICVVAILVDLLFLALLVHPETTEFIRGARLVHHDEAETPA
jgi:hypothetical protein